MKTTIFKKMGAIDAEQVLLKWNNFETNLASGFIDFLHQEAMVDVTLAVEGKLVQAHKIVLSVCSAYFRNMFQVNPCQHPIVILKDVGYQELIDMLDFMYRGEANVKQQDLGSFLRLAETLKVKGLADNCSDMPNDRQSSDMDTSKDTPHMSAKQSHHNESKEGSRDVNRKGPLPRKKRKRSVSPMKSTNESKTNPRNDVNNGADNFIDIASKQSSFMNDLGCVQIKEEMVSDASCSSDVQELWFDEMSKNPLLPGPSKMDESWDGVRKADEFAGKELPESRLLPGSSKDEEPWELVIPQESLISKRTSKPLSLIWSFYNFDCHENKSECKLCGKVFKACPKTGTASVKYHLHFAHQIYRIEGECKVVQ